MITSTDNIIISLHLGMIYITYYSNYSLIINMLNAICSIFFAHASGNLIYTDRDRFTTVKNKILLIQHFLLSISTAGFIVLSSNFAGGYFGKEYILHTYTVVCMGIAYYIIGFSNGLESVRRAFGLLEKDRFFTLFTPFLNIVISVYEVLHWGIMGVLIENIIVLLISLYHKRAEGDGNERERYEY